MKSLHLPLVCAFLPLLCACTPVVDTPNDPSDTPGGSPDAGSTGAGEAGSTGAGESDPSLVCEPRDPLIVDGPPFGIIFGDWPVLEGYEFGTHNLAASCEVILADDYKRRLTCPDENGAMHEIVLMALFSGSFVPTTGPVFVRAAQIFMDGDATLVHQWLEIRAGGDVTGALLLAGFIADAPTPPWLNAGDEAGASWYAPLSVSAGGSEACPEQLIEKCQHRRRTTVRFEAKGAQTVQLFDGREGDVDVNGGYYVVARRAFENTAVWSDITCNGGEYSRDIDSFRVLIQAKSPGAP